MEKRTEKLLNIVSQLNMDTITKTQIELLSKEAIEILEDNFKNEVLKAFHYLGEYYGQDHLEAIKNNDKVKFVHESYYYNISKELLNNNIDKIEKIMSILKEEFCKEEGENKNE